ncbi:MAG TPA: AsmA family protein [Burkholderiaceae bacterium]|nr:AsmA family protein [Burkholderiaceae bacterium]
MRKAVTAEKLTALSTVKCAMLGLIGMVGLALTVIGPFKVPFAESLAKTYYRQAVLGLVVMVALVAGLVTAVVKLFDPNQFKDQLVSWVHERTQRDLVLDGELRVSYFPKLALESGKASLSQRRSAREFAAVDKARVTIAWWPLLRGRLHIDSAEVDGLRAQLIRLKDGSTNVDDLARDLRTVDASAIDLDALRLTRASLQWNDEIAWQRGGLSELSVELGRVADGVASPLSASARVDAPAVGVDARLQMKGRLLFDTVGGRLELARIDGVLDGKALGIDNLTLRVKGDVTALPRERALNADNVVVSSLHKSGLAVFSSVLSAPELRWSEYRLSGTSASFDASVAHPDRTTTLALKVPRFEWAERALRDTVGQVQLTLKRGDGQLRLQGSSPLGLVLDGGPHVDLAALDTRLQLSHPALASDVTAQLTGRLDIDLAQRSATATATGQFAGSDLKLDLAVTDAAGGPRWDVDAELARLDLDALLSSAWLARWQDDATPLELSMLRDGRMKGRVRVGQLKAGGLQMAAVSTRIELDRSLLAIDPIVAQGYGAQLEAALRVDAGAAVPRLSAKGSLNEADLRSLLADTAQASWLEGRGALTWDLTADGATLGSLRNAVTGSLNLTLRGGALAGVDLRAALLDGRADLGKRTPVQQREFDRAASTPFSEMRARFELRDRRANGQALELNAASIRAIGDGELQLDSGVIDLHLLATVGRGAHELSSLAGVSVPMQVQGPWRSPRLAFDFGAASGGPLAQADTAGGDTAVTLVKATATGERAPTARAK